MKRPDTEMRSVESPASLIMYFLRGSTGWFLLLGVRGKALRYALLILVFTLLCLWLAINLDLVWNSMVHTIGLWPTIIIVLLGAIGVWLIIWMFL